MPEKRNLFDPDEAIRDALCQELDSIEAPPAEAAWQRLQLRREAEISVPAEPAFRRRPWTRYSALAAALLLFFFGGWGLYRTLTPDGFRGAFFKELPENDHAEVLTAEKFAEEEADADLQDLADYLTYLTGWTPAELPPEIEFRPPAALDGYIMDETYTKEAESGIIYFAALYVRGEERLLWVQSAAGSREQFIADLEQLLQVVPGPQTLDEGRYRLSINNLTALIGVKEDRHILLMDLSGRLKDTDLGRLLPEN